MFQWDVIPFEFLDDFFGNVLYVLCMSVFYHLISTIFLLDVKPLIKVIFWEKYFFKSFISSILALLSSGDFFRKTLYSSSDICRISCLPEFGCTIMFNLMRFLRSWGLNWLLC